MEFTAVQVASFIGGHVEGDADVRISGFAKIEEAAKGDLTFLANPKYTHYLYTTGASAALVSNTFVAEQPVGCALIRVADPYEALSQLMTMAAEAMNRLPSGIEQPCHVSDGVEVPENAYIGAFAYIGRGVSLGKGVKIYPQVYVGDGVTLGDDTIIYPGARVYHGCRIGARCIVHAGAVIGADGFGFAPDAEGHYHKIPQLGIVEIGDDVEIGANTTIDRATMGVTRVDRGTKLDNLIQLAHNTYVGADTVIASQTGVAGSARIGSRCRIGGQVGVAGHISIGDDVEIGAQSGIPNNVADQSRVMGYPAVPAGAFARQAAMMRRLPDLFNDVKELKKKQKNF